MHGAKLDLALGGGTGHHAFLTIVVTCEPPADAEGAAGSGEGGEHWEEARIGAYQRTRRGKNLRCNKEGR